MVNPPSMTTTASFTVKLTDSENKAFANLSGDWNPLHTDVAYAEESEFGRCPLHGAFSAGLFSRLAGMYLPGTNCLLHGMRLRFVNPVLPPITVVVEGHLIGNTVKGGEVEATVREASSGRLLVEGNYQFGHHQQRTVTKPVVATSVAPKTIGMPKILVTGASGGLGGALCAALAGQAQGVSRTESGDWMTVQDLSIIDEHCFNEPLASIVHCAWPQPDTDGILDHPNSSVRLDYHLTEPIRHCLSLARLLRKHGQPGAMLLLVGSAFARPGRHAWRMPLYSLAKGLIPDLVQILALELAKTNHQVVGITLDVIRGGMNRGLGPVQQQAHADRTLWGDLPDMEEVAAQVCWLLENPGRLVSGAMIDLIGGALP